MALSVFLIGGVAVLIVISVLAFVVVLKAAVTVEAGASVLYATRAARCRRYILLLFGATDSLAATHIHEFPETVYKPRYLCNKRWEVLHVNKIVTVLFLAAVAILFSRDYVPTWIGLTWASPATGVCSAPDLKQALFHKQARAGLSGMLPALILCAHTALSCVDCS